jgi:hypothetical protein
MNTNTIQNQKKEILSEEEKLKCQLLFKTFINEIEYSFDTNYRDDLTFSERVEGFKKHFDYMSQAPIKAFFDDYGEDYFGDSLYQQYQELKQKKQENLQSLVTNLIEVLEELDNSGYFDRNQIDLLQGSKTTLIQEIKANCL